jgi:hypothetical protein
MSNLRRPAFRSFVAVLRRSCSRNGEDDIFIFFVYCFLTYDENEVKPWLFSTRSWSKSSFIAPYSGITDTIVVLRHSLVVELSRAEPIPTLPLAINVQLVATPLHRVPNANTMFL